MSPAVDAVSPSTVKTTAEEAQGPSEVGIGGAPDLVALVNNVVAGRHHPSTDTSDDECALHETFNKGATAP